MSKINPDFAHDIFQFLHLPLRKEDAKNRNFLERFLLGQQKIWEENINPKIEEIADLWVPAKTPDGALKYLKPIVGLTEELDSITKDLSNDDLRRIISLFVPLTGQKGTEIGYKNIIRLFTGSESRIFNWFDFRMIVGENSFGEEQLGEDSWLISVPGVEASQPVHQVIGLWTFENNLKDRSLYKNHCEISDQFSYIQDSPVDGSKYAIWLKGGFIHIKNTSKYDFTGDINIEMFVRTDKTQDVILFQKKSDTKEMTIEYKAISNELKWSINDGSTLITDTFVPSEDIDDDVFRHLAFTVDRTKGFARMWYDAEAGAKIDISSIGDLTNNGKILSCDISLQNRFYGMIDNIRIAKNAIYNVDDSSILIPPATFIEYREEQLDEYYSDIRVVDRGDLNRVLLRRILNLMRLSGERLNILYMDHYTTFNAGKGEFVTINGNSEVKDNHLILYSNTAEHSDLPGDSDYQDYVLQVKVRVTLGDKFGVRFNIQNSNVDYYLFEMNVATSYFTLYKVIDSTKVQISSPVWSDVLPNVDYFMTVDTFWDSVSGTTRIKCFQDRNLLIDVYNDEFEKGRFGMSTSINTEVKIDELEIFRYPLDVDKIYPNIEV